MHAAAEWWDKMKQTDRERMERQTHIIPLHTPSCVLSPWQTETVLVQRRTPSAFVQRINLQVTRIVLTERSRRQTALCVGFANLDGQTFPAHARHQLTAMQCITTVSSHGSTADTNNVWNRHCCTIALHLITGCWLYITSTLPSDKGLLNGRVCMFLRLFVIYGIGSSTWRNSTIGNTFY